MGRKLTCSLAFALFVAMTFSAIPKAWAQESEENNASSTTGKNLVEKNTVDRHIDLSGITRTFYFSNLRKSTELQDVVNTVRVIAEINRISMIPSEGAVVMRGSPEQIALAEKIINELETGKNKYSSQYRVEFKITSLESGRSTGSKTVVLLVDPYQLGKLRLLTQTPIQSASENQVRYTDGSQEIECQVRSESERELVLDIDLNLLNFAAGDSPQNPAIPQIRVLDQLKMELGKPAVISTLEIPNSKQSFKVEATVTRLAKTKS